MERGSRETKKVCCVFCKEPPFAFLPQQPPYTSAMNKVRLPFPYTKCETRRVGAPCLLACEMREREGKGADARGKYTRTKSILPGKSKVFPVNV